MMKHKFVISTILVFSVIISFCRSNTLTQPLSDGKTLISTDETFALGFFTPSTDSNNSVSKRYLGIWYNNIPTQTIIWVANGENPVYGNKGTLSISDNGTLLITSGNSNVIWSSSPPTTIFSNPVALLLDSGNFVVADGYNSNSFAWQSFDYPTDTLVPGMKLGWNLTSGLNRNLTSWSTSSDPSKGNFTMALDLKGDPQLLFWAGSTRKLRSGPWTGQYFSGLAPFNPEINNVLTYEFVNTKRDVYFTIQAINTSISRLVLNPLGVLQQFVLLDSGQWGVFWYTPRTQCDVYLACGPYGAGCYVDGSPMCSCLPGYIPKNMGNWALRDWSGGCVRKTKLDCTNGTDGFVTVQRTLLPDTVNATVDSGLSFSECRDTCLKNCSCTAYASADTRNGGTGCIIWSTALSDILVYTNGGRDLFMRLAAADLGSASSNQSHRKNKATVAIVLCITLGMLILVSTVLCAWRIRRRTGGDNTFIDESIVGNTGEDDMELPLFDLDTIVEATNDFSDKNKLGEGGFGPVYKGIVGEGQEIAVKRLSKTSSQGFDELKTEVILVAKLQHRNLVRLLGCCIQGDERMLVYEYMPNRSLDAFLFDEEKAVLLDWASRYHIIVGIARGLLYLHQDSRFRIIHRDLKASNILLDKDMNPKISDFGLARIFGEDETKTKTARVVGTYGYMAPEYALNGIISVKSDVFSFGVLVLEIISGKRNKGVYLSEAEEYLLGRAWALWKEGNGVQLVSSSIQHSICVDEVVRCIKVGLLCIQERPEDRPTMSSVCLMLSSEHTNVPPPQQPGFLLRRNGPQEISSSDSNSINDLTITMAVGR